MKQTLNIPLLDGKIWTVEAEVIGDLALHQSRLNKKMWTVTHVPTLMTFINAVPPTLTKRAPLLKWMAVVQEGLLKDWLAMRRFNANDVRKHPDLTAKVRERIRNHCLGVK